jgi:hypothetical protein
VGRALAVKGALPCRSSFAEHDERAGFETNVTPVKPTPALIVRIMKDLTTRVLHPLIRH